MERDLAAIQAKLDSLQAESEAISDTHPEEAALIKERISQITTIWQDLTMMVCSVILRLKIFKLFRRLFKLNMFLFHALLLY